MAIKWQEKPDYWLGATEAPYPKFEAWQSTDAVDNRWCLKIIRGAGFEPIEISDIEYAEALAEFAEGFLEERTHSNLYPIEYPASMPLQTSGVAS